MSVMTIKYKKAALGDEHAISLLGAATFLETFAGMICGKAIIQHCAHEHSVHAYQTAISQPEERVWLATLDPGEAPIGYLHLCKPDLPIQICDNDLEIKRIYILKKVQGLGVGRCLMKLAIDHARTGRAQHIFLGVYDANTAAMAFYEHLGFSRVGERIFQVGDQRYHDWIYALTL